MDIFCKKLIKIDTHVHNLFHGLAMIKLMKKLSGQDR